MFKELAGLVVGSKGVIVLTVAGLDDGRIRVTVMPNSDSKVAGLRQGLQLEDTAENIEEGFVGALERYGEARKSLSEQVDSTVAVIEGERKAQQAAAELARKNGKKPGAVTAAAGAAQKKPQGAPATVATDAKQDGDGAVTVGEKPAELDLFGNGDGQ